MLNLSHRYIFATLVLALCIGCTPREPFVYNEQEFNRDAPTFGKKKINITKVRVCYSKISGTSKKITLLAEKECGKVILLNGCSDDNWMTLLRPQEVEPFLGL